MELARDFSRASRRLRWTFVAAFGFSAIVLAAVFVGSRIAGIDVRDLLRDPLFVAGVPALTGFVSNLGVILWSAAAGICFVPALALRHRAETRSLAGFFLASGALTTLLVLDDLFQLHEEIIPGLFGRGETLFTLTLVGLTAAYVVRYRRTLRAGEYPLLVVAAGAFAVSLGIDYIGLIGIDPDDLGEGGQVLEDGAKLVGITLWLAFHLRAAATAVAGPAPTPSPEAVRTGQERLAGE